jgi:hypothetical protein
MAMTGLILFGAATYDAPYGYDYDPDYGSPYDQYYTTLYSGATQNWSMILPSGPGSNGQFLKTDGTGRTSWATVSSGSSAWSALTGAMTYTQVAPWYNATSTVDSGISRLGAASLAIGNGTASDATGILNLGSVNASNIISGGGNGVNNFNVEFTGNAGTQVAFSAYAYNPSATNPFLGTMVGLKGAAYWSSNANATGAIYGVEAIADNEGTGTVTNMVTFSHSIPTNTSTGTITNAIGSGIQLPSNTGSITNMYGMLLSSPINTGTITNAYGIYIQSQAGSGISNPWSLYIAGGASYIAGTVDISESQVLGWDSGTIGTLDTGISRLGAASLAIGNGAVGNTSGQVTAKTYTLSDFGSVPTSTSGGGTAGTVGQLVQHSGVLYFCSVTGVAGSATWNVITMTLSA